MANLADSVYRRVLVVRCQLGDREAFAELVARCQPTLRAYLHKLLASGHNADDVAQEVWMDVFRGLPRLTDPGAFGPWLYRIAHNRAYRVLRRRPEPVSAIGDIEPADDAEPETEFTVEDAQAVHAAIDKLPSEHREVLLLKFMEDMSYEEIAGVVGCPVGTVRSRIHNAKRQLRKYLTVQAGKIERQAFL
jgi:RNA polymerase sigma-70 factor (ECF subfamily)